MDKTYASPIIVDIRILAGQQPGASKSSIDDRRAMLICRAVATDMAVDGKIFFIIIEDQVQER